jgi:4-hydroxybenzoate polyprenyltransferase
LLTFYAGTSVIIPIFRLENVPSYLSLALLICFFFALTIKDIKDSDGDRIAHIQTLSTIFSPKVGNIVTIVCVCIAILMSPWLFRLPNLHIFSVITCAAFLVGIRFIYNAKAKEIFVTALYFLYVAVLMWGVIF